jgi:hypothetical protein
MFLFLITVGLDIAMIVGWWTTKLTFRIIYYGGSYIFTYYNSNRLIEYKA